MKAVTTFAQFQALKAELIAKWGDKLTDCNAEEYDQILADIAPLAKYGRMQPVRVLSGLIHTHWEAQRQPKE
jgi:hypothetical protein